MDRELERALVRECIERVREKRPTMDYEGALGAWHDRVDAKLG